MLNTIALITAVSVAQFVVLQLPARWATLFMCSIMVASFAATGWLTFLFMSLYTGFAAAHHFAKLYTPKGLL